MRLSLPLEQLSGKASPNSTWKSNNLIDLGYTFEVVSNSKNYLRSFWKITDQLQKRDFSAYSWLINVIIYYKKDKRKFRRFFF